MVRIDRVRNALTREEWLRVGLMGAAVVALYVVGFALLLSAVGHHYVLSRSGAKVKIFGVGTGVLALTLGMRHAFDADHIAAIDNTTRKLMGEGQRPTSVGFFFSLGHSSVVFVLAVLLNFGIRSLDRAVSDDGSGLHHVTGIIGTSVSGTFLYLIAALNVVILVSIVRIFREMRGGAFDEAELERRLAQRGLMNRLLGGFAERVDRPWKMYPLGVLFGLGFDTATEVSLLVLSGSAVASGLPFWAILSLPILFAAGMSTFDTLDGCFMNFAYGWAFATPIRKVFYNITITGLSVMAAFVIGTIEILGLVQSEFSFDDPFMRFMSNFNINTAGFVVVGLFVAVWAIALAVWHFGDVEGRWGSSPEPASYR
ncbi:MAG TPA: HoxN/HupN/NixA family nickel/cobalt transporter [Mycobacteriales bacterium]|nr:HoxN/HupN/NixA family nickel/cobalt transporter [Mycobacteriales bacterium]